MLARTAASGCVRAAHRACAIFPRWDAPRVRGGGRACWPEFFPDRSSWREELSLEFAPAVNEAVAVNEGLEAGRIQRAGFDELKQAGLVLGASCLKGNGREVFRREHADGCSFHVVLNRVSQRFFQERIAGGQEL